MDDVAAIWRARARAVVVIALTVGAIAALAGGLPTDVGSVVTVAFVVVCPGLAVVGLLQLDDPLVEIVLGVALSVALAGLLSVAELSFRLWSPAATLGLLIVIVGGAEVLDDRVVPRRVLAWLAANLVIGGRRLWQWVADEVPTAGEAPDSNPGAGPTADATSSGQPAAGETPGPPGAPPPLPPAPPEPPQPEPLPPPPVTVVRRLPKGQAPAAPARGRRRRVTLGIDPLDESETTRSLGSTIDQVLGEIVERRDEKR